MNEIEITIPMLMELCKQEQIREIPKDPSYKRGYREAFNIMENLLGRVKSTNDFDVSDVVYYIANTQNSELLNKLEKAANTNKGIIEFLNESCVRLDSIKNIVESIIHNYNAMLAKVEGNATSNINNESYLEQIQYQDKLNEYIEKLKNIFSSDWE